MPLRRLAALAALSCVSCAFAGLACPDAFDGLWERQEALAGGCVPGLTDVPKDSCQQVGYHEEGCEFQSRSLCTGGILRTMTVDTGTGTGMVMLTDEARGCQTFYPLVVRR